MNMKDKIKTLLITTSVAFLTSCGFKDKVQEPEERSADKPAMGLPNMHTVIHRGADQPTSWETVVDQAQGDSASIEITNRLNEANIPIAKEDSILHDFEISSTGKISKPNYVLNEKTGVVSPDNVQRVGGVEIRRKVDPDAQKVQTYKLDEKTVGVKNWHNEEVEKEFSRVRKLIDDKNIEKSLHKGDTIKVPSFMRPDEVHIVQEDGVSPTKESRWIERSVVTKVVLDYKQKKPE